MEARSEITMYYPCLDCGNDKKYSDFEVVYAHLIVMDLYQITLFGISTERKGLTKGGNGSPIINKGPTARKMVIRMGKKATVMMVKLMTSLMCWLTMLKT